MVDKEKMIAVLGLGYVGLPLAIEFSKKYKVIGFDIDEVRIKELKNGFDRTNELEKEKILFHRNLEFSFESKSLKEVDIYIITVPTPVDNNNKPDLSYLESSSKLVGSFLQPGNIVVYESTVFPGCTEEICVPILENESKLTYNKEFFCGYSPERINPGDKNHTLTNIKKVVSGSSAEILEKIASLYSSIITAGIHKASSIPIAEAAKVIENTQRDVNIALMNELALIFNKLDLDTNEVLEAASTKWNFINFKPGLVGGHCIGVDPYYLTHKALEVGYHPEIILTGRKINDNMGEYIAEKTISSLVKIGFNPIGAKITVLGLTFKENCSDLRNTKVIDLIKKLIEYKCHVEVSDEWAYEEEVILQHNFNLVPQQDIKKQNAVIIAVSHNEYKCISREQWGNMLCKGGLVIDIKSIYQKSFFENLNLNYWRL